MENKPPGKIRDFKLLGRNGTTISFRRPTHLKGDEIWSFQWKRPDGAWTGISWKPQGTPKTAIPSAPFKIKHILEHEYMAVRMVLTNQYGQTYSDYIWIGRNFPKTPPEKVCKKLINKKIKALLEAERMMAYHSKMRTSFRTRKIRPPQEAHGMALEAWRKVANHHKAVLDYMQSKDRTKDADVDIIKAADEATDHARSLDYQPKPVMPKGWIKLHGWQWKLWARTWDKDDHRVPYIIIRPKWSSIMSFIYGFPKRKDLPNMIRSIHLHVPWASPSDVTTMWSYPQGELQPYLGAYALANNKIICHETDNDIHFDIP